MMLGIDCGASTVKLAVVENGEVKATWLSPHKGYLSQCLSSGLQVIAPHVSEPFALGITGCASAVLLAEMSERMSKSDRDFSTLPALVADIPAIVEGVKLLAPQAKSIMEIGSQSSRYVTNIQGVPQFATNEHCAGGTGSFFEDQMTRLGLELSDITALIEGAQSVPRLSGRCAVFAKTDIIHRQQEGATTSDILLGLCYAMIRNYKATIVNKLPLEKPVAFCGGMTQNIGVVRAIRDVFGLSEGELIIPADANFAAAVGAALQATGTFTLSQVQAAAENLPQESLQALSALEAPVGVSLKDPATTQVIPPQGCALGIDIGSTSTDLVLVAPDGTLVDHQYLRTLGDSENAVRRGLASIRERFGDVQFLAVGATGSGRERIGAMIGADVIFDEITAQAKGAVLWNPDVDTIFEIGGQDSKYISLREGQVADFTMNKICAAGTGSFIEEQAARMGIPLEDFGPLALTSKTPTALGERCTVFIEAAITAAMAAGASHEDIAAGLCHSIVGNYLHKVVGSKPVGSTIMLQGGVCYNPGIIAAFRAAYGENVHVNPCFAISGAYGVAALALESVGDKPSTFVGFDAPSQARRSTPNGESQRIRDNISLYNQAGKLLLDGYSGERNPKKKTVGVPYALMMHKFFPMANAFFTSLGYNVLLTDPTDEETIRLSQEHACGETCYPVKLIYGHMKQLIDAGVDYIFLPTIHTMKHETSHVEHNYGCVYMQTAPESVARALDLEGHGITLLSPVFDLDFGKTAMATAMLGLGDILGKPKPLCAKALMAGAMAVRRHTAAVEEQGRKLLENLEPDDKVIVLITRNYGISDPVLNMGIPQLLLERGQKVITLSHLPAHDLDIHEEYPNLYWPFGQHIISGAKIVANHPNLYAVYLTNHGCGPDSMLSHLMQAIMGDKPYLQIEVDEHFSKVGVITRIEAFLNSLSTRPAIALPKNFDLKAVPNDPIIMPTIPATSAHAAVPSGATPGEGALLYVPDLGWYTPYLIKYLQAQGINAKEMCPSTMDEAIRAGRACTNNKEYLPFVALLGSVLLRQQQLLRDADRSEKCSENRNESGLSVVHYLIPQTQGSEADGLYGRVIHEKLAQQKAKQVAASAFASDSLCAGETPDPVRALSSDDRSPFEPVIVAPILEQLFDAVDDRDLFLRALITGDLLYAAPAEVRSDVAPAEIPSWEELRVLASYVGSMPVAPSSGKRIAAVGTPMSLTSLDEGILDTLDCEGNIVLRAPLSEQLWFLWMDNGADCRGLLDLAARFRELGNQLGNRNPYSTDLDELLSLANEHLAQFSGGNGRYRFAKALQMGSSVGAVLTLSPRYENTAMILEMRNLSQLCPAPLYAIQLDNDWDETAWSKLRSFLFYCE